MRKYETIFVLKPNLEEDARKELVERFTDIINNDGEVTNVDEWGQRRLAYEIDKIRDGYYVFVEFKANTELIAELERNYRIVDEVIRFIVVNREEK